MRPRIRVEIAQPRTGARRDRRLRRDHLRYRRPAADRRGTDGRAGAAASAVVRPHHILLVADAMTGQDAVNVAQGFHERLKISGLILTKLDSDARGGAALSVRAVTGAPILFAGNRREARRRSTVFHPDRLASRILGMGDVLTPDRKGAAELRPDQGQGTRAQVQEKRIHPDRFRRADDGRCRRWDRWASCWG